MNNKDLALAGLAVLTYFHNLSVNEAQIKHQFDTNGTGLTKTNWLLAAKSLGLKAKVVRKSVERLPFVHLPAMVWRDDGHHFILAQLDEEGGHHFLLVMWQYSVWLSLVVLASLPYYAIWSAAINPILLYRLNDKFAHNANNPLF